MAIVLGIDGCRGGWLVLRYDIDRADLALTLAPTFRDLLGLPWAESAAVIAVDMPIGLADIGPRACDLAARACLPVGRKSSVFPPPRRYMLACSDWRQAQDLGKSREGTGLSKQAWNITAKIREIDEAIGPEQQERIFEAHPELVFHHLNARDLVPGKRTAEGQRLRRTLLSRAGLPDLTPLLDRYPRRLAAAGDVIDAAACALAARRILEGSATRLPASPPRDSSGLRMGIWY